MPDRVQHSQDKKRPGLTFIVPLEITFSVSTDYKTVEDFKNAVDNLNLSYSDVLRNFLYELAGIKGDKASLYAFCDEYIEMMKKKFYREAGVKPREKSFSIIIENKMKKYIENVKKN